MSDGQPAHVWGPYRGLSYRFAVQCDEPELGLHLDRLLALLHDDGPVDAPDLTQYVLRRSDQGTVTLWRSEDRVAELTSAGYAVEWLLWDINQQVAAASGEHLLLHAGAVQIDGVAVLLPSPSGGGKSTLVAALVGDGADYVSDELVALTAEHIVLPYAKPITLKPGSFDVLPQLAPRPGDALQFRADEWHVRPDAIRPGAAGMPCPIGAIVVPRYVPGEMTTLSPLSDTDGFLALSINTVNLERHGDQGTKQLAEIARSVPAFQLAVSDLSTACVLIARAVGESVAATAKPAR